MTLAEKKKERKEEKIKQFKKFIEGVNKALNVDGRETLKGLDKHYLDTSIEFVNDLINSLSSCNDALSNCEYTAKEEYDRKLPVGKQEIHLTRITRIENYEEMKAELIKLIKTVIPKMEEVLKCYKIIEEYYESKTKNSIIMVRMNCEICYTELEYEDEFDIRICRKCQSM